MCFLQEFVLYFCTVCKTNGVAFYFIFRSFCLYTTAMYIQDWSCLNRGSNEFYILPSVPLGLKFSKEIPKIGEIYSNTFFSVICHKKSTFFLVLSCVWPIVNVLYSDQNFLSVYQLCLLLWINPRLYVLLLLLFYTDTCNWTSMRKMFWFRKSVCGGGGY